jgi:hypothetical protein
LARSLNSGCPQQGHTLSEDVGEIYSMPFSWLAGILGLGDTSLHSLSSWSYGILSVCLCLCFSHMYWDPLWFCMALSLFDYICKDQKS